MQPALNYRQSRRSACDRCRGFKLRCERDQSHGRSCERCLKAQVMCTTSINHPGSNYASSKNRACSFPVECDPRFMNTKRHTMPILHKYSTSKVKKAVSPGSIRNLENSALNLWPYQDPFPSWSSGDMSSFGGDIDLQIPSYPATSFPFEQWEQQSPWASNIYQASPVEDLFLEPNYGIDHQMVTSDTFVPQPTFTLPDKIPSGLPSLPSQSLSLLNKDAESLLATDYNWPSSCLQGPEICESDERQMASTTDSSSNSYDMRKKLLKLSLELIENLESVESTCGVMRSSPSALEDVNSSLSKLDPLFFNLLNHSNQFLEMLPTPHGGSGNSIHLVPSIELSQTSLESFQDAKLSSLDSTESVLEEGPTTASSHDSGYHTIFLTPSNPVRPTMCDTSTALSILITYVQLTRLYRAIFNQFYQILLVASPHDTSSFSFLPNLGQFYPEGSLAMQVHLILNLSSDALGKLEKALGISYRAPQDNGDASSVMSILDSGLLASIRDNVVAQEQIDFGVSLKESMDCLQRLVNDSFCI